MSRYEDVLHLWAVMRESRRQPRSPGKSEKRSLSRSSMLRPKKALEPPQKEARETKGMARRYIRQVGNNRQHAVSRHCAAFQHGLTQEKIPAFATFHANGHGSNAKHALQCSPHISGQAVEHTGSGRSRGGGCDWDRERGGRGIGRRRRPTERR